MLMICCCYEVVVIIIIIGVVMVTDVIVIVSKRSANSVQQQCPLIGKQQRSTRKHGKLNSEWQLPKTQNLSIPEKSTRDKRRRHDAYEIKFETFMSARASHASCH